MRTRIKRQIMQITVDYLDGRTTVAEAGSIADKITESIVIKINNNHAAFNPLDCQTEATRRDAE